MDNLAKYLKLPDKDTKSPPHEKSEIVNMFREFMGESEFLKIGKGDVKKAYPFWLRKVGKVKYGDALEIIKSFESMPIKYNKAGAIVNKLKKFNGTRTSTIPR